MALTARFYCSLPTVDCRLEMGNYTSGGRPQSNTAPLNCHASAVGDLRRDFGISGAAAGASSMGSRKRRMPS